MTRLIRSFAGAAICAVALMIACAQQADAQRVTQRTNLRAGPGTNFPVLTTLPAGGVVNVIRCTGEWCNVTFAGRPGYVVARNLGGGGPPGPGGPVAVVGPPPPVVVVDPAPVVVVGPRYYGYGPYYGRRWGYGYRRW